nr:hypothetical protein [uncultured Anaerobutyricum sp.]
MKKRLVILFVIMLMLLPVMSVYADSGYSAMPEKDYWKEYVYKTIAPKNQTTYKKMGKTNVQDISSIKKQHKSIKVFFDKVGSASTLTGVAGLALKKTPIVGTVATLTGGGAWLISTAEGKFIEKKLSTIKKNTKYKNAVYFKWTDAKKLKYSVKIVFWMTYKGKTVKGSTVTRYQTGSYAWGSN